MNKPDKTNWIDAVLALGLLSLLLLRLFPDWELALSRRFYDPVTGWALDAHPVVQAVYHWATLPALLLAVAGLLAALGAQRWTALRRYRQIGWFIFASMPAGPGSMVNSVFKEHFERPRPRDITEFGGTETYLKVGQPGSSGHGASFPSGHASMGFFLAVPYLILRHRRRRMAVACLVLGTAAGLGIGLVRIMQGGHFLSDVIASGLIVWVVARTTWEFAFPTTRQHWGRAPARSTARPASATAPVPGHVRCLDRAAYLRDCTASGRPLLSVVIPFYNEEETIDGVLAEARRHHPEAEIIAVDDGSSDATWERICAHPDISGLSHQVNQGQSAAMLTGLRAATGEFCALMDGDGQNDPADIPALLAAWRDSDADVICGYRANRRDTWNRRAASRIANRIRRLFLQDGVRDTGCSLKLFHRDAVGLLPPFNHLHRYLPALFLSAGLTLQEVPVNHRPRAAGSSKYTNWQRALVGIHDLFGVSWLLRRQLVLRPATLSQQPRHERNPVHV